MMPSSFIIFVLLLSLICALVLMLPFFRQGTNHARRGWAMPLVFCVIGLLGVVFFYNNNSAWNWNAAGVPDNPAAQQLYELQRQVHLRPEDYRAWHKLGQFYLQFDQIRAARESLNRAVELSQGRDVESMLTLVEALVSSNTTVDQTRVAELISTVLKINPGHRKALWYGGEIAASQGRYDVAMARWSVLLNESAKLNTPESKAVTDLLQERIAAARTAMSSIGDKPGIVDGAVIEVNVQIDSTLLDKLSPDITVFVIARTAEHSGPPLAVQRLQVDQLPTTVVLSDQNAMLPNRKLSDFAHVEVVARVAMSGSPTAQSGDYYGTAMVTENSARSIDVLVSQQIP